MWRAGTATPARPMEDKTACAARLTQADVLCLQQSTQGTCPLCAALLSPAHRKQKTHGKNDRALHSHFGFGNGKTKWPGA